MASKSETVAMDANPSSKPQNETTLDSNSFSSPTKTSSRPTPTSTSFVLIKTNASTSDSKSATLSSTSKNSQQGYPSFSKLLQGVMAANSPNSVVKDVSFQGKLGMSHQEALASVTAKASQGQMQQLRPKPTKSPINQLESFVSSPSAIIRKEKPPHLQKDSVQEGKDIQPSFHVSKPADSSPCKPADVQLAKDKVIKQDLKQEDSCHTDEQADDIPRTPNSDGYGWRKYGQKQVKNSGSSRSYYRCTYFNCFAKKKVQHLDVSGKVIEVDYKGDHNHDPPQNLKGSSRKRDAPSAVQVHETGGNSQQKVGNPHTPTSTGRMEVDQAVLQMIHEREERNLSTPTSLPEKDAGEESIITTFLSQRLKNEEATFSKYDEHCKSSKSDEGSIREFEVVPLKKRRIKETSKPCSESVYRTFKEPKVVLHASGDVVSFDGYRWRKYGQKMVKGNPNPRSYYRCSSAGCPVRKHVERATDDSTAFIVTYEGEHDHDKPVPKKGMGSPKSPAHVAATHTPSEKSEAKCFPRNADSDPNGEKSGEAGAEKVLESAQTLLTIGIELKSC